MNQQIRLTGAQARTVLMQAIADGRLVGDSVFNPRLSKGEAWQIFFDVVIFYPDHTPISARLSESVINEFGLPDPYFNLQARQLPAVLETIVKPAADTFVAQCGDPGLADRLKETADLMLQHLREISGLPPLPPVADGFVIAGGPRG